MQPRPININLRQFISFNLRRTVLIASTVTSIHIYTSNKTNVNCHFSLDVNNDLMSGYTPVFDT